MISPQEFLNTEEFRIIFKSAYTKYSFLKSLPFDECMQETALFMLKYPPKYKISLTTWVYRAAVNAVKVIHVRSKFQPNLLSGNENLPSSNYHEHSFETIAQRDEIENCLLCLTDKQKNAIMNRYFNFAEFAEIGPTISTAKNTVQKSLRKMKKFLYEQSTI